MKNKIKKAIFNSIMFLLLLLTCSAPAVVANAEEATAISIGKIDYDNLTMQVFNNNNAIVYYSTDESTWLDVEGVYSTTTNSYTMDISWISNTSDFTLYFKGDTIKTIKSITLPMRNSTISVKFDKVEGEFLINDVEEAESFQWRKTTDYSWNTVDLDEASNSYQAFRDTMEILRLKGVKLFIRTPQILGTSIHNVGMRPSKEVALTVTERVKAPSVNVNSSKLTLNTSTSMEYYDTKSDLWIECDGVSSIEDIAPSALYQGGSNNVTLMIRRAATTSDTFSKTAYISIPGQSSAPVIGDNSADVTYYYMNSKLILQFNKATTTNIYEYTIIKPYADFNVSTASWRSVTNSKIMTLTSSSAPEGCIIYVRKKGTDASTTRNTALELSSAVSYITVKY